MYKFPKPKEGLKYLSAQEAAEALVKCDNVMAAAEEMVKTKLVPGDKSVKRLQNIASQYRKGQPIGSVTDITTNPNPNPHPIPTPTPFHTPTLILLTFPKRNHQTHQLCFYLNAKLTASLHSTGTGMQ